jgi:hypothetical protein
MNFLISHYTLRNLVIENQKRKICIDADAEEDPSLLRIPKVMSEVTTIHNHQRKTFGLAPILEDEANPVTTGGTRGTRGTMCPTCGQDIHWCECPMTV